MSGYTKLFSSILASTVWREPSEVRIVWITLLAMAGKNGVAEGSVPGVADFARLPVEVTRAAIARLCEPDADSRSQEHEGRRIEKVDGGWLILNHAKYRAKLSADERREYLRMKAREYRRRDVDKPVDKSTVSTQSKAEASPDTKAKKIKSVSAEPLRDSTPAVLEFPVVGKGPKTWDLTEGYLADLSATYPFLDVLAEARKARAWIGANPTRRKTIRGMPNFLVGWLNRATPKHRAPQLRERGPHWSEECKQLHDGACGNRTFHDAKMAEARS